MPKPLITINKATKVFESRGNFMAKPSTTQALSQVDLVIYEGETVGLVGESGSGKTTLGRCVIGLESLSSGDISFEGIDPKTGLQVIFQDPYSALSPSRTALESVMEPLLLQVGRQKAKILATEMLERVSIVGEAIHKLPQAFSGGQRQRIGIARAVATQPKFILCDEPTSALDVSIQAQIIGLLRELQQSMKLTYLFISHDLSVVRALSNRIAVMYRGCLVELGTTQQIFEDARHPYTKRLLMAAPEADPDLARKQMAGQSSDLEPILLTEDFDWVQVEPGHFVRRNVY